MSQQNPVKVFVAHAWQESDDYLRVFEYLESHRNFFYRNCSRPDARPPGGVAAEQDAIRTQIAEAEIVIAPTSTYRQDADLLLFELQQARDQGKPVLLLKPFGVQTVVPRPVMELASRTVEWNDRVLVDAIRELARNEGRAQTDTIEFSPDAFQEFKGFKVER